MSQGGHHRPACCRSCMTLWVGEDIECRAFAVVFAGGAASLPRAQGRHCSRPLQGCLRRLLASWGVQADTIALQMLLLKTAQVGCLRKDEAGNLLLSCWQVAVVPPRGEWCSVHGRPRAENVCFGLGDSTLLILGLLTVPDLCKQLQQMVAEP